MLLERTRHLFTHMVFAALVGAISACGAGGDEHPPPVDHDLESAQLGEPLPAALGEAGASGAGCPPGVVRECKVTLNRQGNVLNCLVGVQLCSDEVWGPCQSLDSVGSTP